MELENLKSGYNFMFSTFMVGSIGEASRKTEKEKNGRHYKFVISIPEHPSGTRSLQDPGFCLCGKITVIFGLLTFFKISKVDEENKIVQAKYGFFEKELAIRKEEHRY